MEKGFIRYHLTRRDRPDQIFTFNILDDRVEFDGDLPGASLEWTALEHNQCPHCPLKAETSPTCPVASQLSRVVGHFEHLKSYDKVTIEVATDERNVLHTSSAQRALCSLLGLLIANSGCPHTEPFRPMARFHLPVASEFENLYRVVSMYVTAQFFDQRKNGEQKPLDMEGLKQIYLNVNALNYWMAKRLRESKVSEATVNGIALLDTYALYLPLCFDETMQRLAELFEPMTQYLANRDQLPDAPTPDSFVPEQLVRKLEELHDHVPIED